MSDERQAELERERAKGQQSVEERLKAAEELSQKLKSSNDRLLQQSQEWKSKAQKAVENEAERLKQIEAEKEQELVQKGEYKKLLEQQKIENENIRKERDDALKAKSDSDSTLLEARKLSAFENRLGGKLKNDKYLGFVDTSAIVIDPDTGNIDASSVDSSVKGFLSEHKDLVSFVAGKLPNLDGAAGGSIGKKQWDKMSLADKQKNLSTALEGYRKNKK